MTTDTDDLESMSNAELNREAAEVWLDVFSMRRDVNFFQAEDGWIVTYWSKDGEPVERLIDPATDPADALELLEGVAERLHKPRIKEIIEHPVDEWSVHITSHTAGNLLDFHVFETDKSKPRAQTIAAIKAWGAMHE